MTTTLGAIAAVPAMFPKWIVVDDDGRDILCINTLVQPGRPLLIESRDLFYKTVESLKNGANAPLDADREALARQLYQHGILVKKNDPAVFRFREEARPSPFFGCVIVELDSAIAPEQAALSVGEVSNNLLAPGRGVVSLLLRIARGRDPIDWNHLLEIAGASAESFAQAAARHERKDVAFYVELPLYPSELGEQSYTFAERFSDCAIYLIDEVESCTVKALGEAVTAAKAAADRGFDIIVELLTIPGAPLHDRARAWTELANAGALRVRFITSPADGAEKMKLLQDRAAASLSDVAGVIGIATQRSQPWKTILTTAMSPLRQSYYWSKPESFLGIAADGRFARSLAHAAAQLYEPLSVLFPESATGAERGGELLTFDGAPDCASCGFAPLCDRYWSVETDLFVKTGDLSAARTKSNLDCSVRKLILGALLDSIHADQRENAAAEGFRNFTKARYDTKSGTLHLDAKGE